MDLRDNCHAFADRTADALYGAETHVADRVYARQARFEWRARAAVCIASQLGELGVGVKLDRRPGCNAIDQIARHAGREALPTYQRMNLGGVIGDEYRGLSGGVAAADQRDFLASASFC